MQHTCFKIIICIHRQATTLKTTTDGCESNTETTVQHFLFDAGWTMLTASLEETTLEDKETCQRWNLDLFKRKIYTFCTGKNFSLRELTIESAVATLK